MTALYIHIPFCRTKCHYCSFNSYPDKKDLHARYAAALRCELGRINLPQQSGTDLKSVFFGGGTPTVLPAAELIDILACCRDIFRIDDDCEISIEANPGTIDEPGMHALYRAGVNRISIGIQSFQASELAFLGRCHSPAEAAAAVGLAKGCGFANISLDLIYGLPGQTREVWRDNLQMALDLGVDHLSLYQLTIEDGTPLAEQYRQGRFSLPQEDEVLEMDRINEELCDEAGLEQYEISNFARPGHQCRHNITYWKNEHYWAAGAGAVSYREGRREQRIADPLSYCLAVEQGRSTIIDSEELDLPSRFRETVVMGLRLTRGISLAAIAARFGLDPISYYGPALDKLIHQGLITHDGKLLRLTKQGRLLANVVLAELV